MWFSAAPLIWRVVRWMACAGSGHNCPPDSKEICCDRIFPVPLFLLFFITVFIDLIFLVETFYRVKNGSCGNTLHSHILIQCYIFIRCKHSFIGCDSHLTMVFLHIWYKMTPLSQMLNLNLLSYGYMIIMNTPIYAIENIYFQKLTFLLTTNGA